MKVNNQIIIALMCTLVFFGCTSKPQKVETALTPVLEEQPKPVEEEAPVVMDVITEAGTQVDLLEVEGSVLAERTVYFDFNETAIKDEFRGLIAAHAEYLLTNPNASIVLEGHCDEYGTREYNIGLGDRRADTIRQIMLLQGARSEQIQTVSFGEERPIASGRDEESLALNRRGEIIYTHH